MTFNVGDRVTFLYSPEDPMNDFPAVDGEITEVKWDEYDSEYDVVTNTFIPIGNFIFKVTFDETMETPYGPYDYMWADFDQLILVKPKRKPRSGFGDFMKKIEGSS